MKRGRKQDDTLPPSRSREIQRAFRQRRSDYIKGLEARVSQLEAEVDEVLARHNELLRYTTPEVVAARTASRKKQRTKSKHSLSDFLDLSQTVETYAPAPSNRLAIMPENATVSPSSGGSNQSICHDICSPPSQYVLIDMNGEPTGTSTADYSKDPFAPYPFASQVEHQPEFDSRDIDSSSILTRRNQRLLHLWEGASKANDFNGSSPDSPGPPSSQFSHPISANEYQCSNSQIEILMGMDAVGQSTPVSASHIMSSFDFQHEVRAPPPTSCSIPSLIADSSAQPDQLSAIGFNYATATCSGIFLP
ncbi:hypothetical protein PTTG_01436 [Puccinia triticina 1-1 BBBD Race 1]|uniref:BZIP domain-containing protein n=2 Tax=Puccinia triticina TaxID=208348 RepID=A0A0C4EL05_PUCT1|nr:uncharacterized protein PtA15_9A292 [Puccinia triticina]OAV99953.1 hypothetical protein PTTG_01436 [Puccinia triticina 1-1 BBBD Race 1]WAQ88167.1 hypothetical protein PtA15_9A292 [Puccinia triticina]WAR60355.1 hypothetical protein PtB15_9B294 [Puccinia triticina]